MNANNDEGKLISGKEALIALANGEEVQIWNGNIWWGVEGDYQIDVFLKTERKFRLKPRTITLNGIEVPAPFEPKEREIYWFMDVNNFRGYDHDEWGLDSTHDKKWSFYGAWRTEEEIKQVVAALRQVFGGAV